MIIYHNYSDSDNDDKDRPSTTDQETVSPCDHTSHDVHYHVHVQTQYYSVVITTILR